MTPQSREEVWNGLRGEDLSNGAVFTVLPVVLSLLERGIVSPRDRDLSIRTCRSSCGLEFGSCRPFSRIFVGAGLLLVFFSLFGCDGIIVILLCFRGCTSTGGCFTSGFATLYKIEKRFDQWNAWKYIFFFSFFLLRSRLHRTPLSRRNIFLHRSYNFLYFTKLCFANFIVNSALLFSLLESLISRNLRDSVRCTSNIFARQLLVVSVLNPSDTTTALFANESILPRRCVSDRLVTTARKTRWLATKEAVPRGVSCKVVAFEK